MAFIKGQRWVSTTEPELGLGIILDSDRRQVRLLFPASEENRVYAFDSAPLERVSFKIGDCVHLHQGTDLTITHIEEIEGLLYYGDGHVQACESQLADTIDLGTADRRLLDGRLDTTALFELRRAANTYQNWIRRHPAHGYLGARMSLIPHQLYIAHEVAEQRAARVLLSDEVGLGKTIEACLILHRLHVRGQSGRVLILVPEALIHQWFVELYRRFNLTCAIFDEERCMAIQGQVEFGGAANPFLEEHLVLTSSSLFIKNPKRLEEALAADWGLVIVDEAHHLQWTPTEVSPEYRLVEALAKLSRGLLLLTGTPEQFGLLGHFARLHLLDPDRFHDYQTFCQEADGYRQTAKAVDHLLQENQAKPTAERETLIHDLLDRQGTGRAVYRNTRATIPGFPKRKVHPAPLNLLVEDLETQEFLRKELGFELGLEEKLPRKQLEKDPRVDWLIKLLKKHPEDKFLLICRYQKRAEQLFEAVQARINLSMALFHEEQTILQRDRAAAWFSQPAPEGARLLICSEIGSEGRNFQFAHRLVLYDLPIDPELLEQRIGRLDRIGQRDIIHLYTPYFEGSGGEILFRWFHEGIDAFSHPIQGGNLYIDQFLPRLRELLTAATIDPKAVEKLILETITFRKALQKKLESGRDRLLEWHSCRPERVASLIAEIQNLDQSTELDQFLLSALDHFGVHVEKMGEREGLGGKENRSWFILPGHLMTDQLPGIPPEGKLITFDRIVALDRDEVDFMSWDHPLVVALLDLLLGSESGNAAYSEITSSDTLPSGLYTEMIYLLEGTCPSRFDLDRFLPATPIRVVLDSRGKVGTEEVGAALAQAAAIDAPRHALTGQTEVFKPLLEKWKKAAGRETEKLAQLMRQQAYENMTRSLDHELERVQALQQRNGKARGREIELLQEERAALAHSLLGSRLRLDALRLIKVK